MLLAIDPGKNWCGAAVFCWQQQDVDLQWAGLIEAAPNVRSGPESWRELAGAVYNLHRFPIDDLVIECPQIYPGAPKTDLNDLFDLAGVAGAIATRYFGVPVTRVFPAQWKGQLPKKTMNDRVLEHLSEIERSRIVSAGALTHNILDAVGIGLYHCGRLGKKEIRR